MSEAETRQYYKHWAINSNKSLCGGAKIRLKRYNRTVIIGLMRLSKNAIGKLRRVHKYR